MQEFGAVQAKNWFGHLLNLVEQGEEVRITRHGREVARLVPVAAPVDRRAARAAIGRMRALSEDRQLGPFDWQEWKSFRDDGRA